MRTGRFVELAASAVDAPLLVGPGSTHPNVIGGQTRHSAQSQDQRPGRPARRELMRRERRQVTEMDDIWQGHQFSSGLKAGAAHRLPGRLAHPSFRNPDHALHIENAVPLTRRGRPRFGRVVEEPPPRPRCVIRFPSEIGQRPHGLGTALGPRFDIPALSEKHPSARDARPPRLRDFDGYRRGQWHARMSDSESDLVGPNLRGLAMGSGSQRTDWTGSPSWTCTAMSGTAGRWLRGAGLRLATLTNGSPP
jgi:hypothetical protein